MMDEEEFTLPPLLVTDDVIKGLKSGAILASEAGATLPGINEENQLTFLTQLCEAYVEKKLDVDHVLAAMAAAGLPDDIGTDVAEALWFCSCKVGMSSRKGVTDTYEHLAELAKELNKKGKATKAQLVAQLDAELLDACGFTRAPMVHRDRRALTAAYYKQDKYNLLREQNEGYGKLLSELLSGGPLQPERVPALEQQIKRHIGTFNLDPNRVCDLVLDAAEVELAHSLEGQRSTDTPGPIPVPAGLQLMSLVGADTPMLMLARKFLHYQQDRPKITGDETEEELTGPPPRSLYLLAACMIKVGQATLEQLLPYLGPAEDMQAQFKAAHQKLLTEIDQLKIANLDETGNSAATKKMAEKGAGGLDAAAKMYGYTNRPVDDEGPGRLGFDPRGGNMPPPGGPMAGPPGRGGMGYPPGGGGWGQPGMAGQYGSGYGPRGGPPYGLPMGGQFPGGPGMGGISGSAMNAVGGGGVGGRTSAGGGGGQAVAPAGGDAGATRYNIMPAEDLALDAGQYDKQLLDPKAGQLQLLVALMQVNAWDAALLMMQWLQDVMQVQVSSDRAASAALCVRVQQLLQPVYSLLYPQGPSYGSVLERFAERPSTARDKDREIKLLVFSAEQQSAQPFGPALDPVAYQLLAFLGPYLYRDAGVMVMLLKVLRHEILFYGGMLRGEAQMETVDKVCAALSDAVLPALSLHPANLGLAHMVWDVLAHMPFPFRAQVYHKAVRVMPSWVVTRAATNLALKSFKRIKSRIALPAETDEDQFKAVVRAQQHLIAKVTHATPLQVTAEIVQWVMNTPNQVEPMAEVAKMRNRLTSDALTYQVLYMWDRLESHKIKADGTSEAVFVQGISELVGRAGVAHPWSSFDLSTMLRYLFSTMKAGDPMGILLLRTMLYCMSGIEGPASADPNDYQSISRGPSLTAYMKNVVYGRLGELQERGRMVLRKLLTTPRGQHDQQLLVPLIVLMAQHLDWTLYTLHTEHVKEVAELYDKISYTTQQYLMLLEQLLREKQLSLQHLAAVLPPVHELIRDYKVAPGIAWSMWRPVFQALQPALAAQLAQRESSNSAALDWAAACTGAGTAATAGGGGDGEEGEVEEGEAMQGVEGPGAAQAPEIAAAAERAVAELGLPLDMPTLLASVNSLGPEMFENLTPQLYLAFWTMELADIYVPTAEYEVAMTYCDNAKPKYAEETRRKQKEIQELTTQLDLLIKGGQGGRNDERYISSMRGRLEGAKDTFENNTAILKRAETYGSAIKQERDRAVAQNTLSMKRLQAEKHLYVTEAKGLRVKLHAFVKFCLLPRLLRSASDAVFCHLFTLKLHELDVPNWPAGFFWDEAMVSLTNIIPTVTEKEAGYLAMFLGLALLKIQVWYNDAAKFKQECDQQTMRQSTMHSVRMSHDQFKKLFRKWQNGLQKGLLVCLEDEKQYYQRRNALTIIVKLINADKKETAPPMFPFYKIHCEELHKALKNLQATEDRQDLMLMVNSAISNLENKAANCQELPFMGKQPIPTSKRGNIPPAGGAKGAAAGAGTRPPASPARQQQQRGGRPSTPPSASAAGGGGGSSAAAKPSEDKQQQKAAAAAGGEDKPAGSGSGQLPKAVRKAPPGAAAAAGVLKKAVEAAAGGAQAAAGSKQTQRPSAGGGPGEDEPPTKRPRTTIAAPAKGDKGDKDSTTPGSTAAAAGGGGGGAGGDKEGREAGKGDGDGRGSKQQTGGRTASRPPSGSAVAAERAAGGGGGSRAASPAGVGSPARGGDRTAGGGDRGGSRMGAGRDSHHGRGDHGQPGSRDHTPQRHGGHSDDPHPKAAAAGEDRKGQEHRSHKGERDKSRDGSRDRTRDPSRGRGHHSPEQPKHKGGAAAAAEEEGGRDSGKKEKRGSRREGGRSAHKDVKKEARVGEEREDSHDSKRRRLNEGPAAAADGASSREQRQHGSNDGGGGGDRGEANGHRAAAAGAAAAAGGGISTRGSRSAEQQQQQGDGRDIREQRREGEKEKEKEKDRKGRGHKEGGETPAEKPTKHERISFPGPRDEKDKGPDRTQPQPSKRRQR